jgi:hypothetical protein
MYDTGCVDHNLGLDAAIGQTQQLHIRGIAGRHGYGAKENEDS